MIIIGFFLYSALNDIDILSSSTTQYSINIELKQF